LASTPPIEQACYWLARNHRPAGATLTGSERAEVAIVGGGLTGLWTALHLKEMHPSLDVAIVEQGRCAYGASGRNAGMVSDTIDHSHGLAIQHFGREEARRLARVGRENVREMLAWLDARGVDCDLEKSGTLHFALRDGHMEDLGHEVEAARELGIDDLRMLDGPAARDELRSDSFCGALFNPAGAILDPVKLVDGLAREALSRGVRLFDKSRVVSFEPTASSVRALGEDGEIEAQTLILATSAYTHHLLPRVLVHFMPLYDYVIVSEPLTAKQRAAIGWQRRQGATDARTFFKYYRLTKDDRILWGTSEAAYYPGNRVEPACDHSERHYEELRTSFAEQFPKLANLEFPFAWGGPICATTRFTPFFGSAFDGRVHYALGFTGHGLATTHLAGKVLAHRALRRPSVFDDLRIVREKPLPYPPEPLRRWAVSAVTKDLRRVDKGEEPSAMLKLLDAFGVGLSS
jgi:glycine/D-amino acid oxidase-like deaminating enzyme